MGKTSDKLNYLDETKQTIKQAIINKGVDVSDTDTFRSFADKISAIETGAKLGPIILDGEWKAFKAEKYNTQTGVVTEFSPGDYIWYFTNGKGGQWIEGTYWETSVDSEGYALRQDTVSLRTYVIEDNTVKVPVGLSDYFVLYYSVEDDVPILTQRYGALTDTEYTETKYKKYLPRIKNLTGDDTIKKNGTYYPWNEKSYAFGYIKVDVEGKEDLTAELEAQDAALTELEEAVNNLPDAGGSGEGCVGLNVLGAWTINPDGSENTINGAYYNFTTDGKIQMLMNGEVSDMGTYSIEGNKINLVSEDEEMSWYYNEDGGIAVEENAESIMWRLVPSGTLEVKTNGDYDVTAKTKVNVVVPAGGTGGSLSFYNAEIVVDENGYNVLQLTEAIEIREDVYAVGQTNENDTLYVINA